MSTKHQKTESIESVADDIHSCFASAWAIGEKVNHEWLVNRLKRVIADYQTNEEQQHIASAVEVARGEALREAVRFLESRHHYAAARELQEYLDTNL